MSTRTAKRSTKRAARHCGKRSFAKSTPAPEEKSILTLYGIPNCDSCRKARKWLDGSGVAYRFHDLRSDGIDTKRLREWQKSVDWKTLLNTRSTTWRGLPEKEKRNVDAGRAVALMVQHPTLIKRPVLETGRKVLVGFSPENYASLRKD